MAVFVAVTGTHSTGKSTFLDLLEGLLQAEGITVGRVADKASDCRDAGFPILRDHTFESTLWIMSSVIRSELEASLAAAVVLVDRPVSDALAYLEAALLSTGRVIAEHERNYLYSLARLHSLRYPLFYRTVLDPTVPLGEGRDPDLGFRALVDNKLAHVLREVGVDAESLPDAAEVARRVRSLVTELDVDRRRPRVGF